MKRLPLAAAVAAVAITAGGATAISSSPAQAQPDTACQQAGIKTLKNVGLLDDVARDGITVAQAVDLGVYPRDPDFDPSAVPNPIPLRLLLADHRAGSSSLFVYPWC